MLEGERHRVADVLAEPRVDGAHVAAAHHQVNAASGEVLKHCVVLGDLHRVIGGDQRGRGREDDPLGLRSDVTEHRGRRGRHERWVVVLAGGEHVEADVLGLQRDRNHRLDALGLGGDVASRGVGRDVTDGENAELQSGGRVGLRRLGRLGGGGHGWYLGIRNLDVSGCESNYIRSSAVGASAPADERHV